MSNLGTARDQTRKAYEEAMEVVIQTKKACDKAVAQAWKVYEEAKKAYEEALAQAWKAYEEARDQAKKKPLLDEAGTAVDLGE